VGRRRTRDQLGRLAIFYVVLAVLEIVALASLIGVSVMVARLRRAPDAHAQRD